jgi:hypothetical protein
MVVLVILAVAAITGSAYYLLIHPAVTGTETETLPAKEDYYLEIAGGDGKSRVSRIYLINAIAKLCKSKPCLVISGTVKNDYARDYYIGLTAVLYSSRGEKILPLTCPESPKTFTVVRLKSGESATFELPVYFGNFSDGIVDYELLLAFEPSEIPPP